MAIASITWVYDTGAIALAVVGALFLAWALFWDRARGRLRCPRCWYDLSWGSARHECRGSEAEGAGPTLPLICPECGRRIVRPRQLRRTRRRWRIALIAPPLILVAYELPRVPAIQTRGWPASVPTVGLVLLTSPERTDTFVDPTVAAGPGPLLDELYERLPLGRISSAIWSFRMARTARRLGIGDISDGLCELDRRMNGTQITIPAGDSTPRDVLRLIEEDASVRVVFDPEELANNRNLDVASVSLAEPQTMTPNDAVALLFMSRSLNPYSYAVSLANAGLLFQDGFRAPIPETVVRLYDLKEQLKRGHWRYDVEPPRAPDPHVFHDSGGPPPTALERLIEAIQTFVAFESWRDNGGAVGRIEIYDRSTLIVRTTPESHLQIERLLAQLAHPEPIETARASTDWPDAVRTIAYDIGSLVAILPPGARTPTAVGDVIDSLVENVDFYGWRDNGGDRSTVLPIGSIIVISTTSRVHAEIIDFLQAELTPPHESDPTPE